MDSNPLPCTVMNTRYTTWSVSKVLYGFDPGEQVHVGFPSCGGVEAEFSSKSEMLVIAYPGYRDLWIGMKESVVPATGANLLVASRAMDGYLRRKVTELMRPLRGGPDRSSLVFEGTIVDRGTPRTEPCSSTLPPMFPLKFDVGPILQGSWRERQATVLFAACGPLLNSPYRAGQRVVVLALVVGSQPPVLRGELLLPSQQLSQAKAALEAAGTRLGATESTAEKSLREKIRNFVRSAHEQRVSILVFAGKLVSPVPPPRPRVLCIPKEMATFRTNFDVEEVLAGKKIEHATVVFEGCWFPPGPDYSTGDHLLVFAIVVNGGELIGRLLAPADQSAQVKAMLDAVLR